MIFPSFKIEIERFYNCEEKYLHKGRSKRKNNFQTSPESLKNLSIKKTKPCLNTSKVCMCMATTFGKSKHQPSKIANPARGQLNRENEFPLSPFAPENLVSRDGFCSPVPRQTARLHTQDESGAYLGDSSRVPRRRLFIHLNRHTPSGQSLVYRVTQLRTDGVQCRDSAGTRSVNLKAISNGCCLGRSLWTN